MSLKLLHLTAIGGLDTESKFSVHADKIVCLQAQYLNFNGPEHTRVSMFSRSVTVSEPYEVVLRMWADALNS